MLSLKFKISLFIALIILSFAVNLPLTILPLFRRLAVEPKMRIILRGQLFTNWFENETRHLKNEPTGIPLTKEMAPFEKRISSPTNKTRTRAASTISHVNETTSVYKPFQIDMAILVSSKRDAFESRQAIRETWAKKYANVFFMVGEIFCPFPPEQRLEWSCKSNGKNVTVERLKEYEKKESEITKRLKEEDKVILLPIIDVRRALPRKLKEGYKWALQNTTAKWFLKTDEDSFVRIGALSDYLLRSYDANTPIIIGSISRYRKVLSSGHWQELNYKPMYYPSFPLGSVGFVVSKPIAQYIADHEDLLFEYQGEDVSIGIWMDESPLVITWIHSKYMTNDGNCRDLSNFVIGHNVSVQAIHQCFDHQDGMARELYVQFPRVGRLGNRMFEYASAYGIAKTRHAVLCGSTPELEEIFVGPFSKPCPNVKFTRIFEKGYGTFDSKMLTKFLGTNAFPSFYLQSYRYFDVVSAEIKMLFHFKTDIIQKRDAWLLKHGFQRKSRVGIHVRLGDHSRLSYLTLPSEKWYRSIMNKLNNSNVVFIVCTDAPQRVKQMAHFQHENVLISDTNDAAVDMAILVGCQHIILSRGTFGWWAAYLSNAQVYYHDEFDMTHKPNKGHVVQSDYYPSHWKKIVID